MKVLFRLIICFLCFFFVLVDGDGEKFDKTNKQKMSILKLKYLLQKIRQRMCPVGTLMILKITAHPLNLFMIMMPQKL